MKRILAVLVLSGLILTTAACGKTAGTVKPGASGETTAGQTADRSEESKAAKTQPSNADKESGGTQKSEQQADSDKKADTGIIAKSDNLIASEDKAALLKKLDRELDELFTSMNELEDVQDSDLE